jgi:hypothetical protein
MAAADFDDDSLGNYNINSIETMKEASALIARSLFDLNETFPSDEMRSRFSMRWANLYFAWNGVGYDELYNAMSPVMDVLNVYAKLNQGGAMLSIDAAAHYILDSMSIQSYPVRVFQHIAPPLARQAGAILVFAIQHCNPPTLDMILSMTEPEFFFTQGSDIMTAVADCPRIKVLDTMATRVLPGANSRVNAPRGGTAMHVVCATWPEDSLDRAVYALFRMGVLPHILDDAMRSPLAILRERFPETRSNINAIIYLKAKLAECETIARQDWPYATAIRSGWKKGLPTEVTRHIVGLLNVAQPSPAAALR